ncbi:dephospho-CoA kinase [Photobacterium phosphoreum]|jgi:dephospho-CoA kinase|uniref:dephospho-CoA kinase n=1 Tax=Photobacterium phosphoreum TaxID=659 RepID=UPI0005D404D4|nr:dephospho-CoA kinase [Photobacterium phosphoreum]KJF87692.1 dephospho-CoA kinase [Photobacterium phosphoreum]MCD9475685.1 dephospho-CoA kinase [Photobacterium phosphoreum]MCD9503104.1 dephospho-CoA kinase [Photobacterium phosphoreum]MCF2176506.1 dephospho-CoA kinase [Photobacterium phosphoreum]OBU37546.1 dephospho-CoA kinase [Photobacterium phosphoreum]
MTVVIGLTGGIGSGKTTVANLFGDYGIDLIDADIIARDVVAIGSRGLCRIIKKFGNSILLNDGNLDRSQLRAAIFSDPHLKNWLNQLLHPLIREQMLADIDRATSPYCLLIVPLMVENNLQTLTDRLLVVDVDQQTQIMRTQQRDNVSLEQIKNILAAQASRQQRLDAADDIICNNGDNQALLTQVAQLHQHYLALAQAAK